MRGTKDTAPAALTLTGISDERLWGDFQTVIARILGSDVSVADRADLLAQAVAELQQGLNVSDTKALRVVNAMLDGGWEQLSGLVGQKDATARGKRLVEGMRGGLNALLDANKQLRPAALYSAPMLVHNTKFPLSRLWQALGLQANDVAQALTREGGKGIGTSRERLYQLLERDTLTDQSRVLAAIRTAAVAVGKKDWEVTELAQAVCPSAVTGGQKDAGGRRNAAAGYVDDVLAGGPLPQG